MSYSLSVSVKPDAPVGLLRDELRLISNDPETPSIPVMVSGMIRGDLTAAAFGALAGPGAFLGRCARPIRRSFIAAVCDPLDRRGRRRVPDVVSRWNTAVRRTW